MSPSTCKISGLGQKMLIKLAKLTPRKEAQELEGGTLLGKLLASRPPQ